MSFVSSLTAFVSYMGFSPDAKDAKHDFECSRGVSSSPLVDISPGDNECTNCRHTEGSFHVREDWIIVPNNEQQAPCLCCVFVKGVPSNCLNKPTQQAPCLCCVFVEGVPSNCLNKRNDSSDSSDSSDSDDE